MLWTLAAFAAPPPNVTVEGDATISLVDGSGTRWSPDHAVPAGSYEVQLQHGSGWAGAGTIRIEEGTEVRLDCNLIAVRCRAVHQARASGPKPTTPEPQPASGLSFEGADDVYLVAADGTRLGPGAVVPAGRYEIRARFAGTASPTAAGTLVLASDGSPFVRCNALARRCGL
ncbi:MAG: hypothetical protein R3F61_03700 [Myxococcota bacterium]